MPYWLLFYHLTWDTRNRQPLLAGEAAPVMARLVRARALKAGAAVFAVNGHVDHIHLVVSVPPKLSIASFVGQVKSGSSAAYNRRHAPDGVHFGWHEDYGVLSVDRRHLANLIAYIERQAEHHAAGTTIPVLETAAGGMAQVIRDSDSQYHIENHAWRAEMLGASAAPPDAPR